MIREVKGQEGEAGVGLDAYYTQWVEAGDSQLRSTQPFLLRIHILIKTDLGISGLPVELTLRVHQPQLHPPYRKL